MSETNMTREMIQLMSQEFGCLEMSEAELERVVPKLKSSAEFSAMFDRVDLSAVVSGRVISLYPRGK